MMDTALNFIMGAIMVAIGAFVLFLVGMALHWLFRFFCYDFAYDNAVESKGEVVDMEYTPARYTHTGKTTVRHPEKNVVIFKTDLKTTSVDSDTLYQRVRVGESVAVVSQERYMKPRFWDGQWEYDGQHLVSVTSEKNQTVEFNDEKPVLNRGGFRVRK